MWPAIIGAIAQAGSDAASPWLSGMMGLHYGNRASDHNLFNSMKMADYSAGIAKDLALFNFDISKQALAENQKSARYMAENTPSWYRQGLLAAGYNPILAISGAGPNPASAPMSTPSASSSGGSSSPGHSNVNLRPDVLGAIERMSQIRQNDAQTDLIKRRTEGEGWTVKTLTASEARGLGASFIKSLGLHFNGSDSQTFLVAYNPITGEFRNLTNTDALGSTGDAHDASIGVSIDGKSQGTYLFKKGSEDAFKIIKNYEASHGFSPE